MSSTKDENAELGERDISDESLPPDVFDDVNDGLNDDDALQAIFN